MSGPLPRATRPVTVPLSVLYGAGVRARNHRFDRADRAARVEVPVISVGNVTAGGSGKSPMVRLIAAHLRAHGRTPAIAMRGYRAASGTVGDEAAEFQRLVPEVPVIVDADRTRGIRAACERDPGTFDVVVLDDGFQHRRLHRDLDIVLVDATRDGLDDRLLPAGWLREPATALRRADVVVLTRVDAVPPERLDAVARRVESAHGAPALARTRHAWHEVLVLEDGAERREPVTWLDGRRVVTSLGIGNPQPMLRALRNAGVDIAVALPARDHQRYDAARCRRLGRAAAGTDGLVVTLKDLVKIDVAAVGALPIIVPIVGLEFTAGGDAFRDRVAAIR